MTNHELPSESNHLAEAYQVLNTAAHDEQLQALAMRSGPLEMSELAPELRNSEAFREFVNEFDWPNELEDSSIEPLPRFTDEQFLGALSSEGVTIDGRYYQVNNFKVWLSVEPNVKRFSKNQDIYGANPALLRAYAIEPEFMTALRTAYNALPKVVYPTDAALYSPEGELVVRGAHIAFRLLGRIMKVNDEYLHSRILFGDSEGAEPIARAWSTLFR